jgi:hypothetical protein
VLAETADGVSLDWPTDDLCYAARYLVERAIPFVVKEPPELHAELRRLAEEVSRIADSA